MSKTVVQKSYICIHRIHSFLIFSFGTLRSSISTYPPQKAQYPTYSVATVSDFNLVSKYKPMGDQPEAIRQLVDGVNCGERHQTLLGVTGSGKTFTIANVIAQTHKPTLVLSHNKTLAAQLYQEFKTFFPDNAVEYFVSYYDYYQPEAYIASTDTYIEKDLAINQELDKLRLSSTMALMTGRRDIIIVSSVSCLYGLGNPDDFFGGVIKVTVGQLITPTSFMRKLQDSQYVRNEVEFDRGCFRVKGDTIDVFVAYEDYAFRFTFFGDEVESIETIDPTSAHTLSDLQEATLFPANLFITPKDKVADAIRHIQDDLVKETLAFREAGKEAEANRLEQRVTYDMEMIKELGYCPGIENYSRYFDGRPEGAKPYCLLDYFPKDFLMVIDESHVTIPQIHAMYGGDRSRKDSLVDYGFRLRAARDNRPLKFEEFEQMTNQVIYVSATPADYELAQSGGVVVEQVVRPTGLLDPVIEVRPSLNQIDDLMGEVHNRIELNERVLITTLTKRMAEELSDYMTRLGVKCAYIHSDVDTLERIQIMQKLREGEFDVLIGVNMLREGLDMPEVSLVAILDADKEGFLRTERSLTQTAGRAARNLNGRVIMYADRVTPAMQATIDSTNARRAKQMAYNEAHNITPKGLNKDIVTSSLLSQTAKPTPLDGMSYAAEDDLKGMLFASEEQEAYGNDLEPNELRSGAKQSSKTSSKASAKSGSKTKSEIQNPTDKKQLTKALETARKNMKKASKEMNFLEAAQYRDEMLRIQAQLDAL